MNRHSSRRDLRHASFGLGWVFALVACATIALGAGKTARRAKPPKFSEKTTNFFFPDARQMLSGQRPQSAGAVATKRELPTGASNGSKNEQSDTAGWSQWISADTIESEVKTIQTQVNAQVQTPSRFKGGEYKNARRDFSVAAVMFGIIGQFDGQVRWKQSAAGLRDLFSRAGMNCKVGTDASFQEAKLRKEDLEKIVRGELPQVDKNTGPTTWEKVANRPPLMQRLEIAQRQTLVPATANASEFRKNRDKLLREAEIVAALAEVIGQPGFEFADDDTYLEYAKTMRDGAHEVSEAARQKNYEQARKAVSAIDKACIACHEGYRS